MTLHVLQSTRPPVSGPPPTGPDDIEFVFSASGSARSIPGRAGYVNELNLADYDGVNAYPTADGDNLIAGELPGQSNIAGFFERNDDPSLRVNGQAQTSAALRQVAWKFDVYHPGTHAISICWHRQHSGAQNIFIAAGGDTDVRPPENNPAPPVSNISNRRLHATGVEVNIGDYLSTEAANTIPVAANNYVVVWLRTDPTYPVLVSIRCARTGP